MTAASAAQLPGRPWARPRRQPGSRPPESRGCRVVSVTGRLARTHPAGPAPTTTYSNIPPPRPPSSTGTGTAPRWNIFRDGKPGAALRHLPSGYPQVNLAWMWGALLAANMAAWLHQLTARIVGEDIQAGHGVRGGKAMIATLRRRLIAVPGRLTRHARHLVLRLPPGHYLLPEVLTRLRQLPAPA